MPGAHERVDVLLPARALDRDGLSARHPRDVARQQVEQLDHRVVRVLGDDVQPRQVRMRPRRQEVRKRRLAVASVAIPQVTRPEVHHERRIKLHSAVDSAADGMCWPEVGVCCRCDRRRPQIVVDVRAGIRHSSTVIEI